MSLISRTRAVLAVFVLSISVSACSTVGGPSSTSLSLSAEPLIGKFVWHDLITDDPDAARQFYADVFGWTYEETTRPEGGGSYTLVKSGDHYVGGMVHLEDPGTGNDYSRWLGYMSVDNVDGAVAATSAAGGEILVAARNIGTIGRAAAVQDPQGAVLGLVRSNHGDPDDSTPEGPARIVWNELIASNDQEAAGFYRVLAGYEAQTLNRRGGRYILLKAGNTPRAGVLQNPIEGSESAWLTYFAVSDMQSIIEKVKSAGGKVLLAPAPDFREGTTALLADPSDAVFVVQKWPL